MSSIFDDLIFTPTLKRRLSLMVEKPSLFPEYSVLYGEPATGKTTFAKRYGELVANTVTYIPCNETGLSNDVWDNLQRSLHSIDLSNIGETKPLSRLYIFDEFHNVSTNKQDRFKTIHDDLPEDIKFFFIVNTDAKSRNKRRVDQVLSGAMNSRCRNQLCFDYRRDEFDLLLDDLKGLYPHLSENQIVGLFPDHRRLESENLFASLG